MFEEEPRMTMENGFSDVVEDDLRGFDHIGPDRAEGQDLNIAPFHRRKIPRFRHKRKRFVFRIARIERGNGRVGALVQYQRARLRKAFKGDPAQILHLSLVPTEERNSSRQRLQLELSSRQTAAQHGERLMWSTTRKIKNFGGAVPFRKPGIGHLQPRTLGNETFACLRNFVRL
jgi:hypothetical protein